ncbi:hypothetical protein PSTG_11944 [Puccinia striiformis f. sp. tritici PST-78]|uniref:UBA domain-containing protein n=1 Tax=Puccinia striiformis f. sp. tritici PST-78 TaxID=1165861 RepID=A0A0L0V651_9BASI|nr:hypothetical protein PSTG_11944 [Puccinia striiformis f. sp. tritici PST-78]
MDNIQKVKEVMGDAFDQQTIIDALNINNNDFERAINYLLESNFDHQLSQSITEAFTSSTTTTNDWSNNKTQELIREPLVLPNSPPKGAYQPLTVTGQTTPIEDTVNPYNLRSSTIATRLKSSINNTTDTTEIQLIDDSPQKRYEAELNAAIQASLETSETTTTTIKPHTSSASEVVINKDFASEDEQISKALEESLAMSGTNTLENDTHKFAHSINPINRKRINLSTPTGLRVQNPHLVFLPCLLTAMYSLKPFRDKILAFDPLKLKDSSNLAPLIQHDLEGFWNGKSKWRSSENNLEWSEEKPTSSEIILAIQRLFGLMTHTKRSYIDVQELSILLGYEEGEMISWSLNEPNKGCHRTYEYIAEAWRELAFNSLHDELAIDGDQSKELEYQNSLRLFHWKGHKLSLPLPPSEEIITEPEGFQKPTTDNSTTSLTLNVSPETASLNEIYGCIDAQVWLPELNQAHFLDGTSQIIAFEIDRRSSSSSNLSNGNERAPFMLHHQFWVDRYLLQKKEKIVELRDEVSRIEGEADISLSRRNQLSMTGDKDLLATLKATIDYLSFDTQFSTSTNDNNNQREKQKKEVLPRFKDALNRLESELSSLDERAKTALAAAKSIFDIDEMRQVGPHELSSVIVSDGFSGREHMWTYVKTDDGKWFKSLDQTVTEVSLETVLNDPAGIHMNSGHIFAIYVLKPSFEESTESTSMKLPVHLEEAIKKDNDEFEAEILEASKQPQQSTYIPPPTEDIEMSGSSPRSDVADAGGPLDIELLPECGSSSNTISFGPPLRLSGGARSDLGEQDPTSDCDDSSDLDDDQEDDDADEDLAELGFLKKITKPLDIRTMTGKVGGRPIWLDPQTPLDPSLYTCSSCGLSMKFLMQLNAPDDSNTQAYYRTLYVYICPQSACLKRSLNSSAGSSSASAVKVFRTQLPQSSAPVSANTPITSFNDQIVCPKDTSSFREWEIVCDEEPVDKLALSGRFENLGFNDVTNIDVDPKKKKKMMGVVKEQDQDAKMKETKALVDDAFLLFQARISRAPDQILRYLRVKTPEIEPLWANEMSPKQLDQSLANQRICNRCGTQRTAELQIIPTLLSSLNEPYQNDEVIDPISDLNDGIDFGTIVIFTCPNSCPSSSSSTKINRDNHSDLLPLSSSPQNSWVQEVAVLQLFSNHGVFSSSPHLPPPTTTATSS